MRSAIVLLATLMLAAPNAASQRPDCRDPSVLAAQVSSADTTSRAEATGITWDASLSPPLRIAAAYDLRGACAADVRGFFQGLMLLTGDQVAAIKTDGLGRATVLQPRPRGPSLFETADVSPAPPALDAVFTSAIRVGYRREGSVLFSEYLGLWQTPAGSLIAAFRQADGAAPSGQPRIIASSSIRIEGIAWFPSPDTPAGELSVLQRPGPAAVFMTIFGLPHNGARLR